MVVNFGAIPPGAVLFAVYEGISGTIAEKVKCYDAVLMANHGVMTIGPDFAYSLLSGWKWSNNLRS